MKWLAEHGLISNVADYEALPLPVIEDARLVMESEWAHQEQLNAEASRVQRR